MLVIGDVMLDVIAAPRGPIETGADTPATIAFAAGGSGANVAAWLGHLGQPVIFAGRCGRDFHAWHQAELEARGVEPQIACDDAVHTGVLVSLVAADGERSFLTDRGANAHLRREDLPDALLDRVGHVHLSCYALADAGSSAAIAAVIAAAATRGISISVDPASVSLIRVVGAERFLDLTRSARICFPNAAEAASLARTADRDTALTRLASHYETVALKLGAAGAVGMTEFGARRWAVPAPAAATLDTTGAGDAFIAGFLAVFVHGGPPEACFAAGVATGSLAVTALGGRPPRPSELDQAQVAAHELLGVFDR